MLRSPFSQRSRAADAFRQLVAATRARHVFLSYSSEGILSREEVLAILSSRGETRVMEIPYPVFGNGAGVSVRRNVMELLFHMATGK
jgi:adenine-specific DNA methylase